MGQSALSCPRQQVVLLLIAATTAIHWAGTSSCHCCALLTLPQLPARGAPDKSACAVSDPPEERPNRPPHAFEDSEAAGFDLRFSEDASREG